MRKLILLSLVLLAFTTTVTRAQDTNAYQSQFKATTMGFVDHLTTATNWNVHVEALYADSIPKQKLGVKAGADYQISPGVYSTLSLAAVGGSAYGLSGQFGIKQQWDLFSKGKILVTTAEKVGAGTCISGLQFGSLKIPGTPQEGDFFGIVGSDVAITFPTIHWLPTLFGGYEKWSNTKGSLWSIGAHISLDRLVDLL